jgi:hypothetical protein
MPYYQEEHNGTVKNYRNAQTPWKSFYSLLCQLGQIYPIKLDIFIGFQRLDNCPRLDISDPRSDISDQPNLSSLHQITEPWQPPWSDISNPRSDMSDLPDLSEPRWVTVPYHPSMIGYIRAPSDIPDPVEVELI